MPVVMDADRMARSITRMAHEIVERNRGVEPLALIGIHARGVPLAARLAKEIAAITGAPIETGALDITLYRDDLRHHNAGPQPIIRRTDVPFLSFFRARGFVGGPFVQLERGPEVRP